MQHHSLRIFISALTFLLMTGCGFRAHRSSKLYSEETPERIFSFYQDKKTKKIYVRLYRRFSTERHNFVISVPPDACSHVVMSRYIYGPPQPGKSVWRIRSTFEEEIVYDSLATYSFSDAERIALNKLLVKQKEMGGCADTVIFKTPGTVEPN